MKILKMFLLSCSFLFTIQAKADFWGGDLIYLAQILENAIKQYAELKTIVENGKDQVNLIREINRGLNDSLSLIRTTFPNIDSGVFKDWNNINDAMGKLQSIYGVVNPSPLENVYANADQSVAEVVTLNNDIYKYTNKIDELGEVIKGYSHDVSPGGAQKLTAQTLGIMLQVMNQSLRSQATGLKLQAQSMAIQNKKDKDSTKNFLDTAQTLSLAMKKDPISFSAPRF